MYTIIEIQTNAEGHTSLITTEKEGRLEAESAWHTAMAYAAISSVPIHSVKMINENQTEVLSGIYDHRGVD